MRPTSWLTVFTLLCTLALNGCTSRSGCVAQSCERTQATSGQLVIWWSPSMRGGLSSDPEHPVDHSIIGLEN